MVLSPFDEKKNYRPQLLNAGLLWPVPPACKTSGQARLVSNQPMHHTDTLPASSADPASQIIDQRLTDLEIKASFSEDLLDELNQVIVRQQQQIDALTRQLADLRQQLPEAGASAFSRAGDELPPHY